MQSVSELLRPSLERYGILLSPSDMASKCTASSSVLKSRRMLDKCLDRDRAYPQFIAHMPDYQKSLSLLRLVIDKFICRGARQELSQADRDLINEAQVAYEYLKSTHGKNYDLDGFENILLSMVAEQNAAGRKAAIGTRLELELAHTIKYKGAVIFDTLTVDNINYNKVFKDDPNGVFTSYIKKFKRRVGSDARYFAVVEHGSETGREHIHVMWFIPNPPNWRDPGTRATRSGKTYREIQSLKFALGKGDRRKDKTRIEPNDPKMWEYGFQTPILVRWPGDIWSERNFVWPLTVVGDKKKPIKSHPSAIVGYLMKYITKDVLAPSNGETQWRIRKTQDLGMRLVRPMVRTMSMEALTAVLRLPRTPKTETVRALLRQASRSQIIQNLFDNAAPSISEIVMLVGRPSLLTKLRTMRNSEKSPDEKVAELLAGASIGVFAMPPLIDTAEYEAYRLAELLTNWKEQIIDDEKHPGYSYTA